MQFSKKPYFMIINEWYTYDKEQGIYVLTDKATKEAKESYKRFYNLFKHKSDKSYKKYLKEYSKYEEMLEKKYWVEKIKNLIDELEKYEGTKWSDLKEDKGTITMSYPIYQKWIYEIFELIEPCFTYNEIVEEIQRNKISIERFTYKQVQATLTYIERSERFCDGSIAQNLENGTIKKLLERLIELPYKGEN